MKTSIRSRLFLLTFGIILLFIAGLILLNNTYLDEFYTEYRFQALTAAFTEAKDIDVTTDEDTLSTAMLAIENKYNLDIQILKQNPSPSVDPPFDPDLPAYVDRIYGSPFSIRGNALANIIETFDAQLSGESAQDVRPTEVSGDPSYIAYRATIVPDTGAAGGSDQTMLALCVAQMQDDDLYLYYILTVSLQSIADSIRIFNTFTIWTGIIFVFLAGIGTFYYSRSFTRPILQMTEVTRDLASLDFSKRVDVDTDDELGVLGNSINKMTDQLEISIKDLQSANEKLAADIQLKTSIDTMRKEFIANASHELKTPISLIMGYSEALRLPDLSPESAAEYLDIIDDEADKMNKLVMSLLKISQLESGFQQLNPTDFALKDLMEETTKLFAIKFAEKAVIHSDYDSLQTVLTNYLSNALNHVEDAMIIRVKSEPIENGGIRISVFNTGKPIPEDSLLRIWESFYKVDKARTRAYGGQGLGLSIVKITLENLGYSYGVQNQTDGVCFHFEIPGDKIHERPNQ
jgi:two-component system sensor histidine kinase VanS